MGHTINTGVMANQTAPGCEICLRHSLEVMLRAVTTPAPHLLPYAQWIVTRERVKGTCQRCLVEVNLNGHK